jgi:tRNA-dihydrouridine synthase 3
LLNRPKRIESIVRAAAAVATHCGITFKTRTAYHKKPMAHTILPQAGLWGAQAVTLHGRTREQRYQRSADWQYIRQVAADMPDDVQLIGNGDVFSWEDYEAHMKDGKVLFAAS